MANLVQGPIVILNLSILLGCTMRKPSFVTTATLSAKTFEFLSSRGKVTKLSVFVHSIANTIDPRVVPNGVVCCVNKDSLKSTCMRNPTTNKIVST